jgi:hypothetical protein
MHRLDKNMLRQLDQLNKTLCKTVTDGNKSTYESDLEIFETVQVHMGCGGCSGTQMSCYYGM